MYQYDFISKTVSEAQVKSIISTTGYQPGNYTYSPRVGGDGFLVQGQIVMNLTLLRNAATSLKISRLEITSPNDMSESAGAGTQYRKAETGTPYQVTVTLDTTTLGDLVAGHYQLYGFKAVQTTMGGGAPLVWFATTSFMASTVINWTEQYQAFTSLSQIITGGQIVASSPYDITLGQTLNVGPNGVGNVTEQGTSGAVSILNTTTQQFTCGISEMQNGIPSPLCAFPLYGNGMDVIAPIEKVLLMFSTLPFNTGTVIEQAYSQAILIDLTSNNQRTVSFDINLGWSWGGASWAQAIVANADLVPLLIDSPTTALRQSLIAGSVSYR
jgi:hypothetical protein